MSVELKRIVVLELTFDPIFDRTPEEFRAMSMDEFLKQAAIAHEEFIGAALAVAGPDGEP